MPENAIITPKIQNLFELLKQKKEKNEHLVTVTCLESGALKAILF